MFTSAIPLGGFGHVPECQCTACAGQQGYGAFGDAAGDQYQKLLASALIESQADPQRRVDVLTNLYNRLRALPIPKASKDFILGDLQARIAAAKRQAGLKAETLTSQRQWSAGGKLVTYSAAAVLLATVYFIVRKA